MTAKEIPQPIYWSLRVRIESVDTSSQVIGEAPLLSAVWPEHADSFRSGWRPFLGLCDLSHRIADAMNAGRLLEDGSVPFDIDDFDLDEFRR